MDTYNTTTDTYNITTKILQKYYRSTDLPLDLENTTY